MAFASLYGLTLRVSRTRRAMVRPRSFACRPNMAATLHSEDSQAESQQSQQKQQPKPADRGKTLVLVGLGNTGPRYEKTRHNVGFELVNEFTKRNNGVFKIEKRFQADVAKVQLADHTIHVVKPRTYMNNSGIAVRAVQKYYNAPLAAMLVVTDDMSLEVGRIRLRSKGSAGGHNGLKSIQKSIATPEYARLKVGVGSPDGANEWKDFVLGTFTRGERTILGDVSWDVMDVLEHWVREPDLNRVINRMGMAQQSNRR